MIEGNGEMQWKEKIEKKLRDGQSSIKHGLRTVNKIVSYKDVKEGGVVVVVQDFLIQLFLNAAVHLAHKHRVLIKPNSENVSHTDHQCYLKLL